MPDDFRFHSLILPMNNDDLDFDATLRGLSEGLDVFNRYALVRQLGRGGMGVV